MNTAHSWDDWLAQSSFVESDAERQGANWIFDPALDRRLGATPNALAASRTSSGDLIAAFRILLLLLPLLVGLLLSPESVAVDVHLALVHWKLL